MGPAQSRSQFEGTNRLGPFVAACFGDLLYSVRKSRGRAERILGTAPAAIHFPRNLSRVAGRRAPNPSLRMGSDWVGAAWNKEKKMARYGGVDYIDFDSLLNDEEKLVRQTARQFVENEIIPIIEK